MSDLNKYILLVMKWLGDPESVSKGELVENRKAAYAIYTTSADTAAAYAAYAAVAYAAEKWVNKYFERTGENKQDYIDAIGAEKRPQEPESKEWDGEGLPPIGAFCEVTDCWNDFERPVNLSSGQEVKILMDYKCPKTGTSGVIFTWIEGTDNIRTEWTGNEKHFRPLKTQEQKDREAFIDAGIISYDNCEAKLFVDYVKLLLGKMFDDGFKAPGVSI